MLTYHKHKTAELTEINMNMNECMNKNINMNEQ